MALTGLPTLTAADPPVEGEGSLDPLGTGAIADPIAEQLVPNVQAGMGRVRFLTAMAVGSIMTDEVGELLITDTRATPPLAFECLLLEGYVRQNLTLLTGVSGTTKARGFRSSGGRLGASPYLKAAQVFGFNGVDKPLATGIELVTDALLPAPRVAELVAAWEVEQGLPGLLNGAPASPDREVRNRRLSRCGLPSGQACASILIVYASRVSCPTGSCPSTRRRRSRLEADAGLQQPIAPEGARRPCRDPQGVDPHLECRHVMHRFLDWWPSTVEKGTAGLTVSAVGQSGWVKPIEIHRPYTAAMCDEKVYLAVKDRKRWFKVVTGGQVHTSESPTEPAPDRLHLPAGPAVSLNFGLPLVQPAAVSQATCRPEGTRR